MTDHIKIGEQPPHVQYYADGVQTGFDYPFPVFGTDDLQVFLDNGSITAGYVVTGAGTSTGGSVQFDTAPAAGRVVPLRRRVPIRRITDFLQGGALRADSFNDEFDRLTAIAQQLNDDLGRAVRAPAFDKPAVLELPARDQRAGKALLFDAGGNVTVTELEVAAGAGDAFEAPVSGAVPRSLTAKLADVLSVRDFGAAGDGLADDTPAFAAALAAAASVYVPPGTYRVTGTITLGQGKTLYGAGDGSIIDAAGTAAPVVEMTAGYAGLHHLRLVGGSVGVKLYGRDDACVQNALHDLTIRQAGTGLLLDGHTDPARPCYWNNIRDVLVIQPAVHGVHLTRSGAGDTPNANRFARVRVYSLDADLSGSGFYVQHGRFNNAFTDCEANVAATAHSCFRIGPDTDKTLIVNLYTETPGEVPNVYIEAGSVETAITNLLSASAGPAIWDFSGGAYMAVNAGYPDKNRLLHTRIAELVVERFRFETGMLEPVGGGLVELDLGASVYFVSATGGAVEARLPAAGDAGGRQVTLKKIDAGSEPVTVTEAGGPGPDGNAVSLASRHDFVTVVSDGAAWHVVASNRMAETSRSHDAAGLFEPDLTRRVYLIDAAAGTVEVRLPAAVAPDAAGRLATVKKSDASANAVTVTEAGGAGPDGATVTLAQQYAFVTVFSDGAVWHVVGKG